MTGTPRARSRRPAARAIARARAARATAPNALGLGGVRVARRRPSCARPSQVRDPCPSPPSAGAMGARRGLRRRVRSGASCRKRARGSAWIVIRCRWPRAARWAGPRLGAAVRLGGNAAPGGHALRRCRPEPAGRPGFRARCRRPPLVWWPPFSPVLLAPARLGVFDPRSVARPRNLVLFGLTVCLTGQGLRRRFFGHVYAPRALAAPRGRRCGLDNLDFDCERQGALLRGRAAPRLRDRPHQNRPVRTGQRPTLGGGVAVPRDVRLQRAGRDGRRPAPWRAVPRGVSLTGKVGVPARVRVRRGSRVQVCSSREPKKGSASWPASARNCLR